MGATRGYNIQLLGLAALWTASALLMVFGTHYGSVIRLAWGIWFALCATVVTIRWIVEAAGERQRVKIERLAQIMASEAHSQGGASVRPLR